jgi:hypothetical protein
MFYQISALYSQHLSNFFTRIKTIFSYVPVLWYDRDWDQDYFFILMRHKLRRMEKALRHGHHLNADSVANQVKTCHLLLDRIIEHDDKWGGLEMLIDQSALAQEDQDKEHEESKRIAAHQELQMEQDLDLLFKTIRKHVRGWWD